MNRLIQRSAPSANCDLSPRETCLKCGDPLGATRPVCFDCGGTRSASNRSLIGFARLFGGIR